MSVQEGKPHGRGKKSYSSVVANNRQDKRKKGPAPKPDKLDGGGHPREGGCVGGGEGVWYLCTIGTGKSLLMTSKEKGKGGRNLAKPGKKRMAGWLYIAKEEGKNKGKEKVVKTV